MLNLILPCNWEILISPGNMSGIDVQCKLKVEYGHLMLGIYVALEQNYVYRVDPSSLIKSVIVTCCERIFTRSAAAASSLFLFIFLPKSNAADIH